MMAPDATVLDGFGAPVRVSSTRGKVVLIDFWATWCGPCRYTMPMIQRLHSRYARQGLVIMGITKEPRLEVNKFLRDNPYTYPIYIDSTTEAYRAYDVKTIPLLLIVDKQGKVVAMDGKLELNEQELSKIIEAELAK